MPIPNVLMDSLCARRRKAFRIVLTAIEDSNPELTKVGHPVRQAILRELHDLEDIFAQALEELIPPGMTDVEEDELLGRLWLMRLDDRSRAPRV